MEVVGAVRPYQMTGNHSSASAAVRVRAPTAKACSGGVANPTTRPAVLPAPSPGRRRPGRGRRPRRRARWSTTSSLAGSVVGQVDHGVESGGDPVGRHRRHLVGQQAEQQVASPPVPRPGVADMAVEGTRGDHLGQSQLIEGTGVAVDDGSEFGHRRRASAGGGPANRGAGPGPTSWTSCRRRRPGRDRGRPGPPPVGGRSGIPRRSRPR